MSLCGSMACLLCIVDGNKGHARVAICQYLRRVANIGVNVLHAAVFSVLSFSYRHKDIPIILCKALHQLGKAVDVLHTAAGEEIVGDAGHACGDLYRNCADALESVGLDSGQGGGENEGRAGIHSGYLLLYAIHKMESSYGA